MSCLIIVRGGGPNIREESSLSITIYILDVFAEEKYAGLIFEE
jgi:hypothetical protein